MKLGEVVRAIVLFLTLVKSVISGNIVMITNESEFRDFVNNVNSGTSYSGTSVYLSSDLSFSENTLEPIGNNDKKYFRGVFDGQGYVINNLTINVSTSIYTGLFGFSRGLTIKNVVLDDSCSVTNSYSGSNNVLVGGIIGECIATNSSCNIENSVNMASVVFSGNTNGYGFLLGGVAGCLQTYSSSCSGYDSYVKNCANYGSVKYSGTSGSSRIGGIVGYSDGNYYYVYLQNCLNYGVITYSGTTSRTLHLGGITGYTHHAKLYNCPSIGTISTSNVPYFDYRRTIVEFVRDHTKLYYCYFTDNVGISSLYRRYSSLRKPTYPPHQPPYPTQ